MVIDLDWEDKMTENDIRHLVQQLSFSYSANKQVRGRGWKQVRGRGRGCCYLLPGAWPPAQDVTQVQYGTHDEGVAR